MQENTSWHNYLAAAQYRICPFRYMETQEWIDP